MLALSPIPEEGAGCRFRVAQYIPYLETVGFDVTVSSFYTPEFFRFVYRPGHHARKAFSIVQLAIRRMFVLLDLHRYDLVLLYREAIPFGPPLVESMIAARRIPIVYDFDDAIFLPSVSEANRAFAFLKQPGRVARILRQSTQVIAGNEFLADFARRHNSAVTVIPTTVDTSRFVPRAPDRTLRPRPVVGWIGSPTTFRYLEGLSDILRRVARDHPFVLKVSGAGRRVELEGLDVEEVPWSLADEVGLFNSCDIGVYPLTDDDWSRGKCGFKAIQCMACGVAVVASAIGVNREIIQDGVNGFLASTPDEWVEKLGRLIADPALRARMAHAGRQTVEARYSLHVTAPQLAAVLASAVGRESMVPHASPSSPSAPSPSMPSAPSVGSSPSGRIV